MITIIDDDDDDFDGEELEPTPAIESINMVLVGMQELYMLDPEETAKLIEQIYFQCSDQIQTPLFIRELRKRAIALKAAQDVHLGITPLN